MDLSNLSDAQLKSLYQGDFSKLSDADLQALYAPAQPDKYQQAAIDEQAALKEKGIDEGAGLTRRLAHGATLGADNTILAAATAPLEAYKRGVGLGEGYNYAKAREDQITNDARQNTGALGTAAELLGGGVAGGGLAKAGVTAGSLLSSAPGLLGRTAASAADAAALSGIAGFNEGNGLSDRLAKAGEGAVGGALVGGGLNVASPFLGRIIGGLGKEIPSSEAIKDAATNAYEQIRDLGVKVKPEGVQNLAQQMQQDFRDQGFRDYLAPKTAGVINELAEGAPEGAFADFSDLHGIRRALGKAAQSVDPTEKAAASKAISSLDDYLNNIPQEHVISGDANAASKLFQEANANYAAAKRSELLQGKADAAELQAASANSGANYENALRQRVKDIIKSPKLSQGFSDEQLAAMNSFVRGTAPANVVRGIGNLLGGGGGLGSLASGGAGFLASGPVGAIAAPAAGIALKKLGNAMADRAVGNIDELVRSSAPFSAPALQARQAAQAAAQRASANAIRVGSGVTAVAPNTKKSKSPSYFGRTR